MFPTDLEVEALVCAMDEDKSGQIELPELVQHMGLQVTTITIISITIIIIPDLELFIITINHPDYTKF